MLPGWCSCSEPVASVKAIVCPAATDPARSTTPVVPRSIVPVLPVMSSPTLNVSPLPTCIRPLLLKIDCGDPDTSNVPLFAAAFSVPSKSTVGPGADGEVGLRQCRRAGDGCAGADGECAAGPALMASAPAALPILSVTLSSVWLLPRKFSAASLPCVRLMVPGPVPLAPMTVRPFSTFSCPPLVAMLSGP